MPSFDRVKVHQHADWNFAGRLVRRLGNGSCLIDAATGNSVSGRHLPASIVGFAVGFLEAGLRAGDRILISCGLNPASTLAYLGAIYAGVVPVLAEERLFATSRDLLLAKSRAQAVWTAKGCGRDCTTGESVLRIHGPFGPRPPESLAPSACTKHGLAALMPTSGTTGIPQLVTVSHDNLRANTEAIIQSQRLGIGERAMLIMSISYCFGASVMQTHLYQGGGVVFDSRFMFPDKVLNAINTYDCTTFAGVPFVYNTLVRRSNLRSIALPRLRRFLQAGGPLAPEIVGELCEIVPTAEFLVMYGQTEATARISCLPAAYLGKKLGSVGLPLDNLKVRIADEAGCELPPGQVGEIQVQGPSVCSGYFDDPESTERRFGSGWLRTDDFGSCDHEGFLWIQGRAPEFVKIRGLRVSLAEVELKVGTIPGISECAAVGMEHPEEGEALAVLIVAEDSRDGLIDRVRHALPPQWSRVSVKFVPELPRTASGKIARTQLVTLI